MIGVNYVMSTVKWCGSGERNEVLLMPQTVEKIHEFYIQHQSDLILLHQPTQHLQITLRIGSFALSSMQQL